MESPVAIGSMIVLAFAASTMLTWWIRRFAVSRSLLDRPNSRSSHSVPTPRGGGGAIVLVVLAAMPLLAFAGVLSTPLLGAFFGAGLLVGVIGWLDDRGDVAARWRLLIHGSAACWSVVWLGDLPQLLILGSTVSLGTVGTALVILYLVWLLNLYNFMDGIDGIASVEAVTVCISALLLYELTPGSGDAWVLPLVLAAAVAGFVVWNFPHARIFMGDAGSGFVGIMLGLLSLQAAGVAPQLFWGWVILLGAFIVDSTFTLLRRLLRGERIYEAHRSHAYQRAARQLGSHVPVTMAVGAINLIWLLPVAAIVALGWVEGIFGVMIAYAPLVLLVMKYGAGKDETNLGAI